MIVNVLIFIIILFFYVHINAQLKTSEDLEIYEMDYVNNKNLQEICNLKQPVLFDFKPVCPDFFEKLNYDTIPENSSFDIKIKENNDYWNENANVDYVVLPMKSSLSLMITDTQSNYFSENNQEFLEENSMMKYFYDTNDFLKPQFTMNSKYDLLLGSSNTALPLRYHTDFHKFICVHSGKAHIKMTPWKSSKYLHPIKDYDNYEFRSPINVWNPQKKYTNEMNKLKFLEFDIHPGYVLYIPSFWWYSIKFSKESDNLFTSITHNSIINCVSNLPNYSMYYLQQSNIQKKVTKTLDVDPNKEADPIEQNDIASEI